MGCAGAQDCWYERPKDQDPTFSALKQEWGTFPDPSGHSTAPDLDVFVSQLLGCFAAGDTPELLGLCLALPVPGLFVPLAE